VTSVASPQGLTLTQRIAAWPSTMRNPNLAENPWTLMRLAIEPAEYGYLEPIYATATLRNMTDLPLSLNSGGGGGTGGGEGTLPTTLYISLAARRGGAAMPDAGPIVADLGRRLRLEPREALQVPLRLDRGGLGYMLMMTPTDSITFTATAILDPRPSQQGMSPGPLGATDTTPAARRNALPLTGANMEYMIRSARDGGDPFGRMRSLAVLAALGPQMASAESDEAKSALKLVADTVNRAFVEGNPVHQAWTLLFIPPSEAARKTFTSVFEAAERSETPLVRIVYTTAQIDDPESAAMNAALRHPNKAIADYAQAHRTYLLEAAKAAAEAEKRKAAEGEAIK
jgi:hypothetical protein